MRDVFTAAEVFTDEHPARAKLVEARDRFCGAAIIYAGEPSPRARVPRDLRVPSRASCREGFEQGESAKTLGFTLLASIGKVKARGDRAEVRFRAKLPEDPKKTYTSAALVIRRGGRWRVVLPCEVLGCDPMLLRGVGIGDTLAFARRRYPQLRCDIVNQGTEYGTHPACRARIARRRYIGSARTRSARSRS